MIPIYNLINIKTQDTETAALLSAQIEEVAAQQKNLKLIIDGQQVRNIAENYEVTNFSDIEATEYRLLEDSSITIRGQQFDNALITGDESETGNLVEIVDSGVIQVTEGEAGDDEDDEEEGDPSYNTAIEPYRTTLSDGDSITINSS